MTDHSDPAALKKTIRDRLSARRASMNTAERSVAARQLADHLRNTELPGCRAGATVAAYVPAGAEPGAVTMLDVLLDRRLTVLLPVVPDGPPAPLHWARYTGPQSLRTGRFGIPAPTGEPRESVETAELILLPAMAVDRRGVRLGRGAGYYDRSIQAIHAHLVAIVYDEEVVDELPEEPYDRRVSWLLTPHGGLRRIGGLALDAAECQ